MKRCLECGRQFEIAYGNQSGRLTCSFECAERRERHRQRLKRYGLSVRAYDEMIVRQRFCCAICGEEEDGRSLAVDHDHKCCPGLRSCGKCVRGLLCTRCNTGLGMFHEDAERLRRAIAYLASRESSDPEGNV